MKLTAVIILCMSVLAHAGDLNSEEYEKKGKLQKKTEEVVEEKESAFPYEIIPVIGATMFNLTDFKGNSQVSSSSSSMASGIQIGALLGYNIDFYDSTLESGLVYMETGTEVSAFFAGVKTTYGYLTVPVYLRAPLGKIHNTPMHLRTGVVSAFLTSATVSGTGLLSGEVDIKDSVNKFDLIANIGVGGVYSVNDMMKVLVDVNYMRGLQDVNKDGGGKNQGLALTSSLVINL